MSKKYYWILDGKYYEVSKETYQKYKKEHDHSKMLQKYEEEVHVFSLDAMVAEDITGHDTICPQSLTNGSQTNIKSSADYFTLCCTKIRLHFIGCRSFFAKGHVCVGYSLASALITPLAH